MNKLQLKLREETRQAMEDCLSNSTRALTEKESLEAVVEAADDVLESWKMRLQELEEE